MFFLYRQNNSGGSFYIDDMKGIGPCVWVEAPTAVVANALAENLGIYFNGCDKEIDCPCCGDRWDSVGEESREPNYIIDVKYDFNYHNTVYVHLLDGTLLRIKADTLKCS